MSTSQCRATAQNLAEKIIMFFPLSQVFACFYTYYVIFFGILCPFLFSKFTKEIFWTVQENSLLECPLLDGAVYRALWTLRGILWPAC